MPRDRYTKARDRDLIQSELEGRIQRYVDDHEDPGAFLRVVLANDLMGAMQHCIDFPVLLEVLRDVANYIYWGIPSICCGDWEAVEKWLNKGNHNAG